MKVKLRIILLTSLVAAVIASFFLTLLEHGRPLTDNQYETLEKVIQESYDDQKEIFNGGVPENSKFIITKKITFDNGEEVEVTVTSTNTSITSKVDETSVRGEVVANSNLQNGELIMTRNPYNVYLYLLSFVVLCFISFFVFLILISVICTVFNTEPE